MGIYLASNFVVIVLMSERFVMLYRSGCNNVLIVCFDDIIDNDIFRNVK